MQESLQHFMGRIDQTLVNVDEHLVSVDARLHNLERRNGNLSGKAWAALLTTIGVVATAVSTVAAVVLK